MESRRRFAGCHSRRQIDEKFPGDRFATGADRAGSDRRVGNSYWGSREGHIEQPDRLTFDLDPDPSLAWKTLHQAADEVRDRLSSLVWARL